MLASLLPLLASAATFGFVAAQYQDPSSELVLDSPACGFYRCAVTWKHGDKVDINWQNAPAGMVNLVLMTNDNSEVAYQIANVSSPSQPGYCDAGNGVGTVVPGRECGRFEFIVPTEWTTGRNYSVRAQLTNNTSIESYTDVVQIQAAEGNPEPSMAFSAAPISGAPTSTAEGSVASSQTATVTAPVSPGASTPAAASSSAAAGGSSASSGGAQGSSASSASPSGSAAKGPASNGATGIPFPLLTGSMLGLFSAFAAATMM